MSRLALASLVRQLARADSGWRPLVAAVALGVALTVLAFALAHRSVEHMSEMAVMPSEARVQITVSATDPAKRRQEVERDLVAIRAVPRVQSASWLTAPLRRVWWHPELYAANGHRIVGWTIVADDAADDTLALELVAGRLLTAADLEPADFVPIVVTRSFLAALGGGAWLGARVENVERGLEGEVVGVVEDYLSHGHMPTSRNTVLWPSRAPAGATATYLVRTREEDVSTAMAGLERVLASPGRLVKVERMADVLAATQGWAHRMKNVLHTISAALILTVLLGTVAVCAFRVVERRRYLGILRALGARRLDVAALVVAESTLAALGGIVVGFALALVLHWILVPLVPFLELTPGMFVTSALLFLGASALAALAPALMAARVPPSIASRAG